jgi:hypothetical protein
VIDKLADKVLLQGRADWVSLEEVDMAGRFLADDLERRAVLETDAVLALIDRGLADLGRVDRDGWHRLTEPRSEWRRLLNEVTHDIETLGLHLWIQLTAAGKAQAAIIPDSFPGD